MHNDLLVHVALVVLPGSGRLVDLPLAVDAVVQQDETPAREATSYQCAAFLKVVEV